MADIEYHRIDARDKFAGSLDQAEMCDAICNMNTAEQIVFKLARKERNEKWMGSIILESIERQYKEKIEEIAQKYLKDEQEAQKEDAGEMRTLREGRDAE